MGSPKLTLLPTTLTLYKMEPLDLSWTVKQEQAVASEQIGSMVTSDRPWNLSLPRRHSTSDSDRSYTSSDYQDTSDGEGSSSPTLQVESLVSDPYRHQTKRFLQKYLSESQSVQTQDLINYGIDPALIEVNPSQHCTVLSIESSHERALTAENSSRPHDHHVNNPSVPSGQYENRNIVNSPHVQKHVNHSSHQLVSDVVKDNHQDMLYTQSHPQDHYSYKNQEIHKF